MKWYWKVLGRNVSYLIQLKLLEGTGGKRSGTNRSWMLKEALYSHKEKSCTHVVRIGNYPYLSMFVQIRWGYHYQGKNKFHSDENMPGKYCFKRFAFLYTLNSLLGMCTFTLLICGVA